MKNKRALGQLMINWLLWLCVVVVIGVLHFVQGNSASSAFPWRDVAKFIDPALVGLVCVGGALLFTGFSLVRQKSSAKRTQETASYFADLALDEIGSALYNFGSLLAACAAAGAPHWYFLATPLCWGIGYLLKPNEAAPATQVASA